MLNACKRDMGERVDEDINIIETPKIKTQSSMDYSSFDSLSLLTVNLMQTISSLDQNTFCELKQINDSNLSIEDKMNAVYLNQNLNNIHNHLVAINNYIINYNLVQRYAGDNGAIDYFGERILLDLEFDTNAPNNDPCAVYKSAISACRWGFSGCSMGSLLAGGALGAIILVACIMELNDCVGSANLSHPNCVPNNTIFKSVFTSLNELNINC